MTFIDELGLNIFSVWLKFSDYVFSLLVFFLHNFFYYILVQHWKSFGGKCTYIPDSVLYVRAWKMQETRLTCYWHYNEQVKFNKLLWELKNICPPYLWQKRTELCFSQKSLTYAYVVRTFFKMINVKSTMINTSTSALKINQLNY